MHLHHDGQRFLMVKEGGATGETRQEIILVQSWFEELKRWCRRSELVLPMVAQSTAIYSSVSPIAWPELPVA